jgi:hypothetical protein
MHGSIRFRAARYRRHSQRAGGTAIGMLAIVLLLSGSTAFAACEQEAARLCASGDSRCLEGAAKSVEQAISDCKTPEGRQEKAALWQATPTFFDGQPDEHRFWRCVASLCDDNR